MSVGRHEIARAVLDLSILIQCRIERGWSGRFGSKFLLERPPAIVSPHREDPLSDFERLDILSVDP
jgi:hypothetical protein